MHAVSPLHSVVQSGPILIIRAGERNWGFDASVRLHEPACCVIEGSGTLLFDDGRMSVTGRDAVYELLDVSDAGWEDAEWQ